MTVCIRQGSFSEAIIALTKISEFTRKETEQTLSARLKSKTYLILIAKKDQKIIGVKIGYQLDQETFYSWLGGVSPCARGYGVAQLLLETQELWVHSNRYRYIRVKSRNQFPGMLRLLLKNNYQIEHFELSSTLADHRIHFVKEVMNIPSRFHKTLN